MEATSVDVKFLWDRLVQQLGHLVLQDRRRVAVALITAYKVHDGQFRKSGEPFVTHPVEVARILGGLSLNADIIIAGLLHDTVEDTDKISFEDIGDRFGADVRRIVEAMTRLTKIEPTLPGQHVKDVDFQHFFMSMSQDASILLVKLADRLHNMRTMESLKSEKQKEKAKETLQVYAPLAGLLCLDRIKEELEELSVRYLDPDRYFELKDHLKKLHAVQGDALELAKETLQERLDEDSALQEKVRHVIVTPRQKSIYSLYKLYERSQWKLEGNLKLSQVAQLHVQLETDDASEETAQMCYYVMGLVHLLWSHIPGKMKDYIATPRPTSWKGLLTSVWPSSGVPLVTPIEVLIQTSQMCNGDFSALRASSRLEVLMDRNRRLMENSGGTDEEQSNLFRSMEESEIDASFNGSSLLAGRPKGGTVSNKVTGVQRRMETSDIHWNGFSRAKNLLENLERLRHDIGRNMSPQDYADCVRDDFLSPSVYVLTPAGECVQLPEGSTVLDFAYHVHTQIGNRAVGAKVDGRSVGPRYVLRTAQVVEIVTFDWQPSQEYYNILRSRISCVQTTSARRKLKMYLKTLQKRLKQSPSLDGGDQSATRSKTCFWVIIYCQDTPGVLADVARVITNQGLNITRHWGHKKKDAVFVMKYHVHDPGGTRAPELTLELEDVDGCTQVVTGCTLPELTDPLGWHYPANQT